MFVMRFEAMFFDNRCNEQKLECKTSNKQYCFGHRERGVGGESDNNVSQQLLEGHHWALIQGDILWVRHPFFSRFHLQNLQRRTLQIQNTEFKRL